VAASGSIPARAGLGVEAEASESSLAARRSYCGPWPELRCTGATGPRCGGAGGRGARGSTAPGGLGLGFPGVRVPLFVGQQNGLGVRAERESLTGDLGWPVRIGEKEGGGRRGETLMCRPWLAERERECSSWGRARPRARAGPREEEGEEARLGLADGGGLRPMEAGRGRCGGGDRPMGSGDRPMWSELGLGAGGAGRPMGAS
jgi:hypothetical protein